VAAVSEYMARPVRSVLLYYGYKATMATEFYRPIMYLFFLSEGLTFTQIAVLEGLYNVTTVLGEVPTGYVGDRVGRRNSLLLGTVGITGTLVAIASVARLPTRLAFPALCACYVAWSLSYTFRSGSEDAWLYDTLTEEVGEDRFAHVRGRGQSVALLVGVVGSVVGGYLGGVNLAYPFYVAAGVTALGLVSLLAMGEPARYEESGSDELGVRESLGIVRRTLSREGVRAFVLYYFVLFSAASYLVFMFLQPTLETVFVEDVGLAAANVESLLGWYYAAISLVSAGLSYYTGAIEDRFGVRGWFLAVPFVVGVGLAGIAVLPLVAVPVLLLARAVAETSQSLASTYVNDRAQTTGRATVLSSMAMVSAVTVVPFQLASGALTDATGSAALALAAVGVVLLVGSLLVLAWESPFAASATTTADGAAADGD
jgi:MFS family permease